MYLNSTFKPRKNYAKDLSPEFKFLEKTDLPYENILKKCKQKNIIVIGNGGSINNIIAIHNALKHKTKKKLYIIDSTENLDQYKSLKNSLLISISKSGSTANVIYSTKKLMKYHKTLIISSKNSILHKLAEKNKLMFFPHPNVGGRYTAAHDNTLLPISILFSLKLAKKLRKDFDSTYKLLKKNNIAKKIANMLYDAETKGYTEVFMPIYSKSLMGVGKLIRQLNHETYCKHQKGLTFLIADAPECQHHTNQRFFGGRKNIVLFSIKLEQSSKDGKFLNLEHQGVFDTAVKKNIPSACLTLKLDEIAKLIALWQFIVIYSAALRKVNPYDQPAVEESKLLTKKYLKNSPKENLNKNLF